MLEETTKRGEQKRLVRKNTREYRKYKIPCQQCKVENRNKEDCMRHVESIHEGINCNLDRQYSCEQELEYNCEQCEHKTAKKSDMMKHIKSIHEYHCDHCEYKATDKGNIDSIHKGM